MKKFLFLIGVIVTVLLGCDVTGVEPESRDVLFPLAEGNQWVYLVRPHTSPPPDTFIVNVDREIQEAINGESRRATIVRSFFKRYGPDASYSDLYANLDDGLYLLDNYTPGDTALATSRARLYPYPASVGDSSTHIVTFRRRTAEIVTHTVAVVLTEVDAKVTVPAGDFRCHVYRWYVPPPPDVGNGFYVHEYFAPGVGLIKQVLTDEKDSDVTMVRRLLYRYQID